jgi:hypothetical protein
MKFGHDRQTRFVLHDTDMKETPLEETWLFKAFTCMVGGIGFLAVATYVILSVLGTIH